MKCQFLKGGIREDEAFGLSKLFGVWFKRYTGNEEAKKAFDTWFKKFDVRYNVPNSDKSKVHFQFIGEKGGANLNDNSLYRAKNMEANGTTSEEIRKNTGWFRGIDRKWRREIQDGETIENPNIQTAKGIDTGEIFYTGTLKDIYNNSELYKIYPYLADLKIIIQKCLLAHTVIITANFLFCLNYFLKDRLKTKQELCE